MVTTKDNPAVYVWGGNMGSDVPMNLVLAWLAFVETESHTL